MSANSSILEETLLKRDCFSFTQKQQLQRIIACCSDTEWNRSLDETPFSATELLYFLPLNEFFLHLAQLTQDEACITIALSNNVKLKKANPARPSPAALPEFETPVFSQLLDALSVIAEKQHDVLVIKKEELAILDKIATATQHWKKKLSDLDRLIEILQYTLEHIHFYDKTYPSNKNVAKPNSIFSFAYYINFALKQINDKTREPQLSILLQALIYNINQCITHIQQHETPDEIVNQTLMGLRFNSSRLNILSTLPAKPFIELLKVFLIARGDKSDERQKLTECLEITKAAYKHLARWTAHEQQQFKQVVNLITMQLARTTQASAEAPMPAQKPPAKAASSVPPDQFFWPKASRKKTTAPTFQKARKVNTPKVLPAPAIPFVEPPIAPEELPAVTATSTQTKPKKKKKIRDRRIKIKPNAAVESTVMQQQSEQPEPSANNDNPPVMTPAAAPIPEVFIIEQEPSAPTVDLAIETVCEPISSPEPGSSQDSPSPQPITSTAPLIKEQTHAFSQTLQQKVAELNQKLAEMYTCQHELATLNQLISHHANAELLMQRLFQQAIPTDNPQLYQDTYADLNKNRAQLEKHSAHILSNKITELSNALSAEYQAFTNWIQLQTAVALSPSLIGPVTPQQISYLQQAFYRNQCLSREDHLKLQRMEQDISCIIQDPVLIIDLLRFKAHHLLPVHPDLDQFLLQAGHHYLKQAQAVTTERITDALWNGFKTENAESFYTYLRNFGYFATLFPDLTRCLLRDEEGHQLDQSIRATLKTPGALTKDTLFKSVFGYNQSASAPLSIFATKSASNQETPMTPVKSM